MDIVHELLQNKLQTLNHVKKIQWVHFSLMTMHISKDMLIRFIGDENCDARNIYLSHLRIRMEKYLGKWQQNGEYSEFHCKYVLKMLNSMQDLSSEFLLALAI